MTTPIVHPTPAQPQPAAALVVESRRADGGPRQGTLVPIKAIDFYPPPSEGANP